MEQNEAEYMQHGQSLGHYGKWKKLDTRDLLLFNETSTISQSLETPGRVVVSRARGPWERTITNREGSRGRDEIALDLDTDDSCVTLWIHKTYWINSKSLIHVTRWSCEPCTPISLRTEPFPFPWAPFLSVRVRKWQFPHVRNKGNSWWS